MKKIPYGISHGHLSVEVILSYASNVFLLDQLNYLKYNSNQPYKRYGGYYNQNPVNITVKGTGRWYLIVETDQNYKYRFY